MKHIIAPLLGVLLLVGCSQKNNEPTSSLPLVLKARVPLNNVNPEYGEKYFVKPILYALDKSNDITRVHAEIYKDGMTYTVYFLDEMTYTKGKSIILKAMKKAQPNIPQKIEPEVVEINPDEMTNTHKSIIADIKGVSLSSLVPGNIVSLENEIEGEAATVEQQLASFDPMMPPCDCEDNTSPPTGPLYVIESVGKK